MTQLILLYLVLINAIGFILMLADKQKARKNRWRIPEATLIGVAAIGGSIGAYAGMHYFRHKTRHWYFKFGFPILTVLEGMGMLWILIYKG